MIHPPEAIFVALRDAALRTGIPLTLLMAVAKIESDFIPTREGPLTAAGWKAQGLMQLSPETARRLAVRDPFDAKQSAIGGATLLAELAMATDWNLRRMLAAYVWGATKSEKVPDSAQYPPDVEAYIRKVTRARAYYENLANPKGADDTERLANAIEGLRELNPTWTPSVALAQRWAEHDTGGKLQAEPDEHHLGLLAQFWSEYARLFPVAPITDGRTPPPWKLNPDVWPKVAKSLDETKAAVKRIAIDVTADASNFVQSVGVGLGGAAMIGLVLFAVASRRRRSF